DTASCGTDGSCLGPSPVDGTCACPAGYQCRDPQTCVLSGMRPSPQGGPCAQGQCAPGSVCAGGKSCCPADHPTLCGGSCCLAGASCAGGECGCPSGTTGCGPSCCGPNRVCTPQGCLPPGGNPSPINPLTGCPVTADIQCSQAQPTTPTCSVGSCTCYDNN